MLHRKRNLLGRAALLLAGISLAHAHHPMDHATPTAPLDGLLSGPGHPITGNREVRIG